MVITIWSDFACPFCYIGEAHLEQAISELGLENVQIDYMAYELNPQIPKDFAKTSVDHFARAFNLTKEKATEQVEKIARFGRAAGLDFRYTQSVYCNTFDAHRLVKFANATDKSKVHPLVEALFAAFFTDGLVIADRDVLLGIAERVGLDREKSAEMLDSDAFADEVRANEREADMQGVDSVPYMLIDGTTVVNGAQPVAEFKAALQKAAQEAGPTTRPHACGSDGCLL